MDIRVSDYQDYKNAKAGLKKIKADKVVVEQLSRLAKDLTRTRCQSCRKYFPDNLNKLSIRETGYCLACDHILSDK